MQSFAFFGHNERFCLIEKSIPNVIYKEVGYNIEVVDFLKKIVSFKVDCVIIDTTDIAVTSEKDFMEEISKFKITFSGRIIIFDMNRKAGCRFFHLLSTHGVYDIVEVSEIGMLNYSMVQVIDSPKDYAHGLRFIKNELGGMDENKPSVRVATQVVIKNKLVGRPKIALMGSHNRVGVTHLSLMLAFFLKRKGFKVAFLNLKKQIDSILYIDEWNDVVDKGSFKRFMGVDFYSSSDVDFDINTPLSQSYDFFVYDVGIANSGNPYWTEFNRADYRGIVSTGREWETKYLSQLMKTLSDPYAFDYLFSFANDSMFKFIETNLNVGSKKYNLFQVPYEPDISGGLGVDTMFEKWLDNILDSGSAVAGKDKSNLNIFGKFFKNKE